MLIYYFLTSFILVLGNNIFAQNHFKLERDFSDSAEILLNENKAIIVKNESQSAFFRIDYSSKAHKYFYLEKGDSATFWYDSISNKILYSTTYPELFEFVDLTSGQGELEHIMITYQAEEMSEKIRLSDSIVNAMLARHAYLKSKYQSLISETFWDAQEMNIVCHPLSSLTYFADDSLILGYMEKVLDRVQYIPQSTHAKIVHGALSCKTPEYIEWRYPEEIKTPEGYHRVLLKYFKPDVAEILLVKKLILEIEMKSESVEQVNQLADAALLYLKSELIRSKIESIRHEVIRKIEQLDRLGFSLFSNVVTLDGKRLSEIGLGQKPKYLMVTSSGCAPCIQASRWLKDHYEVVSKKMEIYSVVVGRNERFKADQVKDPYPWPVFYDEMSEVQKQLPKPAVPQYFVIRDGRLAEIYAPAPHEYFRNVVGSE